MSTIDEILWLLKDGEWHDLEEIAEKTEISKIKVDMVVSFLGEYDFIQINNHLKKIKLKQSIIDFFDEIQRIEKEDALSQ